MCERWVLQPFSPCHEAHACVPLADGGMFHQRKPLGILGLSRSVTHEALENWDNFHQITTSHGHVWWKHPITVMIGDYADPRSVASDAPPAQKWGFHRPAFDGSTACQVPFLQLLVNQAFPADELHMFCGCSLHHFSRSMAVWPVHLSVWSWRFGVFFSAGERTKKMGWNPTPLMYTAGKYFSMGKTIFARPYLLDRYAFLGVCEIARLLTPQSKGSQQSSEVSSRFPSAKA